MPHGVCDEAIAEQLPFNGNDGFLSMTFLNPAAFFLYQFKPLGVIFIFLVGV